MNHDYENRVHEIGNHDGSDSFVRTDSQSDHWIHSKHESAVGIDAPRKPRVLIADGNATVRKLIRWALRDDEYEIVEASNGPDAYVLATESPEPIAILLDANLGGGMTGHDVCRSLKDDLQFCKIPVIMLVTIGSHEEISDAVEAGADEVLSKPIHRDELNIRIRSATRSQRESPASIDIESVTLTLAHLIAIKDGYSSGHAEQVANYAVAFGKTLGMDHEDLRLLRFGAMLHNIGKVSIPDAILEKTTALTPRERAIIHQHPRVGSDICVSLKQLEPVLPIIRHHKEHFDGTGFPDGLRGDQIPLKAQIVGIADVFSALTNDRSFRRAKTKLEAIEILKHRVIQGMHDPKLVEQFCQMILADSLPAADTPNREANLEASFAPIVSSSLQHST
ncbi:response regulator [Roseiconus lacunae]|uniref:response regulator n=1 Tax=Roseiconus lacunae TaxID=2605694 RepID=UPI001E50B6CC|nr:HD domain-containing phosphohydrolase [Roseiconus lacunae]MCD0461345.1 response regulator [Roseiconus lacunae]